MCYYRQNLTEREEMHMARIKRGAAVASMLMLIAVVVSACRTPYSTPPAGTPTSGSLFETPINQTPGITMSDVANFGTSTALALSGTPGVVPTQTLSVSTPDLSATVTPTALASADPAFTSTATLAVSGTLSTSAPVGARPSTYTLRRGEFPYCLARRFDVDPGELLARNNLTTAQAYNLAPGTVLSIPQSGSFPGDRALRAHPATHTVASSTDTLYSIACFYGDVDPAGIAQANNIAVDAALTTGQPLTMP
jgi:LysM repeat protein